MSDHYRFFRKYTPLIKRLSKERMMKTESEERAPGWPATSCSADPPQDSEAAGRPRSAEQSGGASYRQHAHDVQEILAAYSREQLGHLVYGRSLILEQSGDPIGAAVMREAFNRIRASHAAANDKTEKLAAEVEAAARAVDDELRESRVSGRRNDQTEGPAEGGPSQPE